jgi:hypothetical protein
MNKRSIQNKNTWSILTVTKTISLPTRTSVALLSPLKFHYDDETDALKSDSVAFMVIHLCHMGSMRVPNMTVKDKSSHINTRMFLPSFQFIFLFPKWQKLLIYELQRNFHITHHAKWKYVKIKQIRLINSDLIQFVVIYKEMKIK